MTSVRLSPRAGLLSAAVLVVTFAAMVWGAAQRHVCLGFAGGPPGGSNLCVSDVSTLYGLRGLAGHAFPYGTPGPFGLPDGTLEYPVLTGLFGWLVALPAWSAQSYYLLTALILTGAALLVAGLLTRLTGARALLFAASPLLVYYGTQNWDMLPVLATVAGIFAWSRKRDGLASVAFAIGAALKIYPLLFLVPLYADVRAREGRAAAIRAVAPGIAVGVAVNLPFIVRDRAGWWAPFAFQQNRPLDESALSLWSVFVPTLTLPLVNALANLALLVGVAVVCFVGSRRLERDGVYPVVQVCAAVVVVWLLTAKAGSPQYALWLLPFFALLRVSVWFWATFTAAVVWCHVAFFSWFEAAVAARTGGPMPAEPDFTLPVVVRAVVLVVLAVVLLRAKSAITTYGRADDEPLAAQPHVPDRADGRAPDGTCSHVRVVSGNGGEGTVLVGDR